jgi:osmotically-inducible protein OsmY
VDTELEKSQALEAARTVPGVERVEDRLLVLRS